MRLHFLLKIFFVLYFIPKKRKAAGFTDFFDKKKAVSFFQTPPFPVTLSFSLILYLMIRTFNTPSTASSAFTISSVALLSRSIMV